MGSKWRILIRPSKPRDSSQTKRFHQFCLFFHALHMHPWKCHGFTFNFKKEAHSFIQKILGFVPLRIIFYTVMCCVSILEGARILLLKKRPEICFMGVPHSILHLIFKNNFLYRHVLRKHPWRSPNFIVKEEDRVSIHAIQLCSVSFRNNFSIPSCVA